MRLRVGAKSDTGRVRPLNEDAFMLREDDGLFVVCDGMGGGPAGEVASRMAVEAIAHSLNGGRVEAPGAPAEYMPHTTRLVEAVRRSNEAIRERALANCLENGMGTTVVAAWIRGGVAGVAHVGDSRAYLWRDARLESLTRDHSLAEAHRAAGLVEELSEMPAEQQNLLVRVLGGDADVDVDVREVALRRRDTLLLCSDGLTRMVDEAGMAAVLAGCRDPQGACDRLVEMANENGGADNITVVVVQVAGRWWHGLLDRWTGSRRGDDGEADAAV